MRKPTFFAPILSAFVFTWSAGIALAEPESGTDESQPTVVPGPGLRAGDKAPDPQVAKRNGDPVQLAELYPRGPIVLIFYRGGWCPYCNKALAGIQTRLNDMGRLRGTVLGITPEGPDYIKKTMTDLSLRYDIISDYKGEAARQFGVLFEMPEDLQVKYKEYGIDVAEHNWDRSYTLPHPSVFVIDREGIIRYAFSSEDYKVRADPQEIVNILQIIEDERKAERDANRKPPVEP